MRISVLQKSDINFQKRFNGNEYIAYKFFENYNGELPDSFILNALEKYSAKAQNTHVLDLGAGQGRNTIPIAQKGFKTTAIEVSPEGLECIKDNTTSSKLNNIKIIQQNLLDEIETEEKVDFALMSHITQHFNIEDLRLALSNISNSLKKGGEVVFDALVRKDASYKDYDKIPKKLEATGNAEDAGIKSFNIEDIIKVAEQAKFKLGLHTKFNEGSIEKRALFERSRHWGGDVQLEEYWGEEVEKKPVELTWFLFRKLL